MSRACPKGCLKANLCLRRRQWHGFAVYAICWRVPEFAFAAFGLKHGWLIFRVSCQIPLSLQLWYESWDFGLRRKQAPFLNFKGSERIGQKHTSTRRSLFASAQSLPPEPARERGVETARLYTSSELATRNGPRAFPGIRPCDHSAVRAEGFGVTVRSCSSRSCSGGSGVVVVLVVIVVVVVVVGGAVVEVVVVVVGSSSSSSSSNMSGSSSRCRCILSSTASAMSSTIRSRHCSSSS